MSSIPTYKPEHERENKDWEPDKKLYIKFDNPRGQGWIGKTQLRDALFYFGEEAVNIKNKQDLEVVKKKLNYLKTEPRRHFYQTAEEEFGIAYDDVVKMNGDEFMKLEKKVMSLKR